MKTPNLSSRERSVDEVSHNIFQTEAEGKQKKFTAILAKKDGKVGIKRFGQWESRSCREVKRSREESRGDQRSREETRGVERYANTTVLHPN